MQLNSLLSPSPPLRRRFPFQNPPPPLPCPKTQREQRTRPPPTIYMYVHTSLSLSLSLYIYCSEEERGVEREEGEEEEERRRRRSNGGEATHRGCGGDRGARALLEHHPLRLPREDHQVKTLIFFYPFFFLILFCRPLSFD